MAMRQMGISFEVSIPTPEVLSTLEANRATHAQLVADARAGYIKQATKSLQHKLAQLAEGKPVQLNDYNLTPPSDHTYVYDTTIAMLRKHDGATVRLNADEYRHLMEDVWDWTSQWVSRNSAYSASTSEWAQRKRLDD
jgi:hypothetical protein